MAQQTWSKVMGFRWNFYGFFLYALVWIVLYFVWAIYMARKEK